MGHNLLQGISQRKDMRHWYFLILNMRHEDQTSHIQISNWIKKHAEQPLGDDTFYRPAINYAEGATKRLKAEKLYFLFFKIYP